MLVASAGSIWCRFHRGCALPGVGGSTSRPVQRLAGVMSSRNDVQHMHMVLRAAMPVVSVQLTPLPAPHNSSDQGAQPLHPA